MQKKLLFAIVTLLFTVAFSAVSISNAQETIPREQAWQDTAWQPFTSLNPLQARAFLVGDQSSTYTVVYERLTICKASNYYTDPWPLIAKTWGWIDEHTYEITLDPLAHFRKGSPVTSADVIFSIEIFHNTSLGFSALDYIESLEAVDDYTVRITTTEDSAIYYPTLETDILRQQVLPKYQWEPLWQETGADILTYTNLDPDEMDGSGPYTLLSVISDRLVMVRVDDYWGQEIGYIYTPKYLSYFYTESTEVDARMFQTGEREGGVVHAATYWEWIKAQGLPWGYYNPDADDPKVGITRGVGWGWPMIPNYDRLTVVLENQWLRHALAYAIDMDRVLEVVFGLGSPCVPTNPSWLLPGDEFKKYIDINLIKTTYDTAEFNGVPYIRYNPDKAIELLEEYCEGSVEEGWTLNGEPIGPWTVLEVSAWEDSVGMDEVVAKCWSDIGIQTTVIRLDYSVWDTRIRQRDFDWVRMDYGGKTIPPIPVVDWSHLFVGKAQWPWAPQSPIWYEEYFPEDAAIIAEKLEEMKSYSTDSAEYIALGKEIQAIIIPQLPLIPVMQRANDPYYYTGYWTNVPWYDDDDFIFELTGFSMLLYIQPAKIETIDFTLNPGVAEAGETVIASVTLRNTGDYEQLYRLEISNGPAKPGAKRTGDPPIIAFQGVTVPGGRTITVGVELVFNETGTYTLTVDNWRYSKFDPGDPLEETLVVLPKPEYTIKDAIDAANAAKTAAQALGTTLSDLSSMVSDLSDTVDALSGIISSSLMLLYATVGLQVVVLVIVLVVLMRAQKKP